MPAAMFRKMLCVLAILLPLASPLRASIDPADAERMIDLICTRSDQHAAAQFRQALVEGSQSDVRLLVRLVALGSREPGDQVHLARLIFDSLSKDNIERVLIEVHHSADQMSAQTRGILFVSLVGRMSEDDWERMGSASPAALLLLERMLTDPSLPIKVQSIASAKLVSSSAPAAEKSRVATEAILHRSAHDLPWRDPLYTLLTHENLASLRAKLVDSMQGGSAFWPAAMALAHCGDEATAKLLEQAKATGQARALFPRGDEAADEMIARIRAQASATQLVAVIRDIGDAAATSNRRAAWALGRSIELNLDDSVLRQSILDRHASVTLREPGSIESRLLRQGMKELKRIALDAGVLAHDDLPDVILQTGGLPDE